MQKDVTTLVRTSPPSRESRLRFAPPKEILTTKGGEDLIWMATIPSRRTTRERDRRQPRLTTETSADV